MASRRSHPRYGLATPWEGAVRVLREVAIANGPTDELLAVSHAPGVIGEEMFLDVNGDGRSLEVRVRVIGSRPVIIDGAVRHRIRLVLVQPLERMERVEAPLAEAVSETGHLELKRAAAEPETT